MKKSPGITLVELLVIFVVVGILSAIVVTRFKSYYSVQLYNAARLLTSDIKYAQNTAEITQLNHRVTFSPALDKYVVTLGTTTALVDPVTRKPMERDFTRSKEFKNIDIQLAEFPAGGGTDYVEFNPLGVPSSGGRVVLEYKGEVYEITVSTWTGYVNLNKIP